MHSEEALEEEVSTTSSETAPSLQQKLDHQRPIILCQIQKVIQVILHGIPDVVLLRGRSISFISAEVLNICQFYSYHANCDCSLPNSYLFYLKYIPKVKGPCRTLGIYFR